MADVVPDYEAAISGDSSVATGQTSNSMTVAPADSLAPRAPKQDFVPDYEAAIGQSNAAPSAGPSGIVANTGAGLSSAAAHTLGAPVDLATGALNLGSRAVKAATGYNLGQISHPAGGSQDFEDLFGLVGADPRKVSATTAPEQVARSVGEGVGSMVVPGLGAEAALGSAAGKALSPMARTVLEGLSGGSGSGALGKAGANAAAGAASGAGQYVGNQTFGPLGGTIGSLVGGIAPGAGAAAYRAVRGVSAEQEAARQLWTQATDPKHALETLSQHDPNLPGSQLTTPEIANDPGLLQLQNTARAKNQAPFQAIAQQNNAAPVQALNGLAPADASPQKTAEFFRNRLDQIDAAQQAVVDGAQAHAQGTLGQLGGQGMPEDYGAAAQAAIRSRYAAPLAGMDQAEQKAQQQIAAGLGAMGGDPSANPGLDQGRYGAALRQFVQEGSDAANRETNGLWNTVRQNGDIAFDPAPAVGGVQTALSRVNTAGGDVVRPEEQRLYDVIQSWKGPQSFDTIKSMRTNLGAETNAAAKQGDRQALARLQAVKSGLDASMDAAVSARVAAENQAVASGIMAPENTVQGQLFDRTYQSVAAPQSNAAAGVASGRDASSPSAGPSAAAPGYGSPMAGADGAGLSAAGRSGNAAGNPSVSPGPSSPSLLSFLINRGGLQDQGGELAAMDARLGRVGLVRKAAPKSVPGQGGMLGSGSMFGSRGNGMSLDYAREAAEEAGYIRSGSDINDLLDAVRTELSGTKVYPAGEVAGAGAEGARNARLMQQSRDQVSVAEDDLGARLSRAEHEHAAELVAQGAHPHDAIDQATRSTQEQVLANNAARNAFGEAGAAGARQMPLSVPTPPRPQYTPDARGPELAENYAKARQSTRDYHQTYTDSATGNVLQRGPYGGPPPMSDPDVPAAYWHSGKDALADAQNYIAAVRGRPEAISQLQDYAAFDLRRNATNPDGSLNIPAWQRWMKSNAGPLGAFPEVRAKFEAPAQAQQQLAGIRQQRAVLDKQLQDALGDSPATVMGKYFKPGPAGSDALRDFQTQTGGTAQAQNALEQHVAMNLRQFAAPDGVLIPTRYRQWVNRYEPAIEALPDAVRARFEDAGSAATTLEQAIGNKVQAVKDYENSAARFWLKNDPSQAVAKALADKGTAVQNMRGMMDKIGTDPAAYEGLRRAVLDHIMGRSTSNVEAGQTGTNFLKSDTFQNALRPDGLRPALNAVFSRQDMKTLDAIAQDLQQANRSVGGSKAPIGPGTARDVSALGRFGAVGHSLLSRIAGAGIKGAGMFAGHAISGTEGLISGAAAGEVMNEFLHASRAAKQEQVADLITNAILDPEQGRILLTRAAQGNTAPLMHRLAQRMGQVAATYPLRYAPAAGGVQ